MFDDLEVGSHQGVWIASVLLALLLAGVAGGLWVRDWQQARAGARATGPALPTMAEPRTRS